MNDHKVRALIETIYGTHFNTIGVLAVDARFSNNVWHSFSSLFLSSLGIYGPNQYLTRKNLTESTLELPEFPSAPKA
jgi:hypothetical protein